MFRQRLFYHYIPLNNVVITRTSWNPSIFIEESGEVVAQAIKEMAEVVILKVRFLTLTLGMQDPIAISFYLACAN